MISGDKVMPGALITSCKSSPHACSVPVPHIVYQQIRRLKTCMAAANMLPILLRAVSRVRTWVVWIDELLLRNLTFRRRVGGARLAVFATELYGTLD